MLSAASNRGSFVRNYQRNIENGQQALERASAGKRINQPSDDPSGFVAAEEIRGEIVRLQAELKGIGHRRLATRQEQLTLAHLHDQLIALQGQIAGAASGFLTDDQRTVYGQEIAAGLEAIERIGQPRGDRVVRSADAPATTTRSAVGDSLEDVELNNLPELASTVERQRDSVNFSRAALAAYEKEA